MSEKLGELSDRQIRGRILDALEQAFKKGGVDEMMTRAYQIEAGLGPFKGIENRGRWLADLLREIDRAGKLGDTPLDLTPNQKSKLHMYRDDLRRNVWASVDDPLVKRVVQAFKYDHKETKEGKIDRLKKRIRDATGISGSKAEQIADAIVRGREVERLAVQKGWPIEDGIIKGDGGEIALSDLKA